jgi:NitT/TauT family transport system substrate-binding protein
LWNISIAGGLSTANNADGGDVVMKRYIVAFSLLTLALILTAGISVCSAAKASQSLSIGVLPDVDSIPLIIARQNGYFKKEGLDVRIEKFKSAQDRDSALQTGNIDGAISDILAAAFAGDGGFEVKITSMTNGSYKLLAGKHMGQVAVSNLKGKSIAISKNTIIEYSTDKMLSENGMRPDDVEKTAIPQIPVRLEMLNNGKVDAATLPEPLASSAVKAGAKILESTDKLGINPGVLIFSGKSVQSKAPEIRAFYKAYNSAIRYLQKENLPNYIDTLVREAGFPASVKDVLTLPAYTKAALPAKKDFDGVIEWLKSKGLIKHSYKYEDLVDPSFAK